MLFWLTLLKELVELSGDVVRTICVPKSDFSWFLEKRNAAKEDIFNIHSWIVSFLTPFANKFSCPNKIEFNGFVLEDSSIQRVPICIVFCKSVHPKRFLSGFLPWTKITLIFWARITIFRSIRQELQKKIGGTYTFDFFWYWTKDLLLYNSKTT